MNEYSLVLPSDQHIRVLKSALERARGLLDQKSDDIDYDEIHSVKSILYAAIEQVGMKADRLFSAQRMLRELFVIVTTRADLREHERAIGMQIIDELRERYGIDLLGNSMTQRQVHE